MSNQTRLRTQQAKLLAMQAFQNGDLSVSDTKEILSLLEEPPTHANESSGPQFQPGLRH